MTIKDKYNKDTLLAFSVSIHYKRNGDYWAYYINTQNNNFTP